MESIGYVYLISNTEEPVYKIGVTRCYEENRRLKSIQTGNSQKLKMLMTFGTSWPFRLESMLHNRFKEYRLLGEWFELPKEIVDDFDKICEQENNKIKVLLDNPFFNKGKQIK